MPSVLAIIVTSSLAFLSTAYAQQDPPMDPPAATAPDADLEALPEALRAQASQALAMMKLDAITDPNMLQQALTALQAQAAQVPEQAKPLIEFLAKKLQARIAALQASGGATDAPAASDAPADSNAPARPDAAAQPDSNATKSTADTESADQAEAAAMQEVAASPEAKEALDTFMHGILIGRADISKASAEILLADSVTPQQLADLVDRAELGERFDRAMGASSQMQGIAQLAQAVNAKLFQGRLLLARDSSRVIRAVAMLTGTLRQQSMGLKILESAGAYASRYLLKALTESNDSQMELMAARALTTIGRVVVVPLCTALPQLPPGQQVRVCQVLADIGSKVAAPSLATLVAQAGVTQDVKEAATSALRRIGVAELDPAVLWTALARLSFVGGDGLLPYPEDPQQLIWSFDPSQGLMPTAVATIGYLDLMAQRYATHSMQMDSSGGAALSIYLAAGLRLQAMELGIGDDGGLTPSELTLAAGSTIAQQVLSLGIEIRDPGLQRSAIQALSMTAGTSLLTQGGERNPLVMCLDSGNRRVRAEAALALARAMPSASFSRSDAVVPILAGALRAGGKPAAAIVSAHDEDRRNFEAWLTAAGFEVLGSDASVSAMRGTIAGRGSPDLVVIAGSASEVSNGASELRGNAVTSGSLLLAGVSEIEVTRVDRSVRDDPSANIWFLGNTPESFAGAVGVLMNRSGGGAMTGDDMLTLSMQAADALIALGRAGGGVFRMADGEAALLSGLSSQQGELRIKIAEVLSLIPSESAQRALLSNGLSVQSPDRSIMLRFAAASARRFGDKAEPAQVDRLRALLVESKGANAAAAAECYGALNLGPNESVKLILK